MDYQYPLHEAAKDGNIERAKEWCDKWHANEWNASGQTPLNLAIDHGHYEMAEFLIKHGADVNLRDRAGWSPYECALYHEDDYKDIGDIVKLLIRYGAQG